MSFSIERSPFLDISILEVRGPSGPHFLVGGPSSRLDFVLRALQALLTHQTRPTHQMRYSWANGRMDKAILGVGFTIQYPRDPAWANLQLDPLFQFQLQQKLCKRYKIMNYESMLSMQIMAATGCMLNMCKKSRSFNKIFTGRLA